MVLRKLPCYPGFWVDLICVIVVLSDLMVIMAMDTDTSGDVG